MNGSHTYFLKSARLGFRYWSQEDLPLALALWGNPEVMRLLGGPLSPAQVQERLRQEITWQAAEKIQYWPVFFLTTQQHVGCAGLRPYKPAEQIHELGFHLLPAFWGKGLGEESGRAVIGYAFTALGARGLFAGHHPANAASRRVLERLGFHYTGEELYTPTGLLHPSYFLAAPEHADTQVS